MPRITVTLSDAAKEWVEAEAEARECSQSDVLAALVDEARGADTDPTVTDRLNALEERVDELEDQRTEAVQPDAGLNQPDAEPRTGPMQAGAETDAEMNQPDADVRTGPVQADAAIRDLVEEMEIPGRSREMEQRRREVALELLEWTRDRGQAQKSDVEEEFYREEFDEKYDYGSAASFWEKFGKKVLKQALDAGAVEKDGWAFRWVGSE
jgi:hypothetical protein